MTGDLDDLSWRPPHAYVPGRTQRHPEDLFDFLKTDVSGCAVGELPDTYTWLYAEVFYDEGFYWEAHELLEAVWMACPPNSAEKIYVQAKIQKANAALKRYMGHPKAVTTLSREVEALLEEVRQRSNGVLFNGRVSIRL